VPFTIQETPNSEVLARLATKLARRLTWTLADDGETLTVMLLTSVTAADAELGQLVA
jgi:hypothetical protein